MELIFRFSEMSEVSYKGLTDKEKSDLIEEVRLRPALWDPTHQDYKKIRKMNMLYDQIASFLTKTDRKITGYLKKII